MACISCSRSTLVCHPNRSSQVLLGGLMNQTCSSFHLFQPIFYPSHPFPRQLAPHLCCKCLRGTSCKLRTLFLCLHLEIHHRYKRARSLDSLWERVMYLTPLCIWDPLGNRSKLHYKSITPHILTLSLVCVLWTLGVSYCCIGQCTNLSIYAH